MVKEPTEDIKIPKNTINHVNTWNIQVDDQCDQYDQKIRQEIDLNFVHKNTIECPNYCLNLKANYLIIKENYSENTLRNIKKANKNKLREEKTCGPYY